MQPATILHPHTHQPLTPPSPHPWRKVQSVPCVRAQRPEWYCFISWYSPTVTQQHTLVHTHTEPAVQPGRFIQPTDLQRAPWSLAWRTNNTLYSESHKPQSTCEYANTTCWQNTAERNIRGIGCLASSHGVTPAYHKQRRGDILKATKHVAM